MVLRDALDPAPLHLVLASLHAGHTSKKFMLFFPFLPATLPLVTANKVRAQLKQQLRSVFGKGYKAEFIQHYQIKFRDLRSEFRRAQLMVGKQMVIDGVFHCDPHPADR